MLLNVSPHNLTTFGKSSQASSNREKNKQKVDEAAVVTGGVGAGVTATRSASFKMFNSSAKLNRTVNGIAEGARAVTEPVKQSKSLWNALKLNYRKLTADIAAWAKKSGMPKFIKPIFTGRLASIFGGAAAVFVFITGSVQVVTTAVSKLTEVGNKISE